MQAKQHEWITTTASNYYRPAHQSYQTIPSNHFTSRHHNQIFVLPEAVLAKPELRPSKKKSHDNKKDYSTVQIEDGSRKNPHALPTSALSHTRYMFRTKKRQNSLKQQRKVHAKLVMQNINLTTSGSPNKKNLCDREAYDTLKILQKVILNHNKCPHQPTEFIQLQANKLPIIYKQDIKRQKSVAHYDPKYKWQPSLCLNQKNSLSGMRKKVGSERPFLSGWEHLDNQID